MSETDEALKIWSALKPMVDRQIAERTRSCVRAQKMTVTTNENLDVGPEEGEDGSQPLTEEPSISSTETVSDSENSVSPAAEGEEGDGEEEEKDLYAPVEIGVTQAYNAETTIPAGSEFSDLEPGSVVWVYWYFDNASTMHIARNGDGTPGTADLKKIRNEIAESQSAVYSYITNVEGDIYSEIYNSESAVYNCITQVQDTLHSEIIISTSELRTEFVNTVSNVYSSITQTAETIRAEVHTSHSELYSYIEMTASYIRSEVGNTVSGLYSSIEQTASHIRADVWAAESSMYSYIELTASNIKSEVGNTVSGLYSTIEQTASHIRADVWAANSDIYSYIELTASNIKTEVGNAESGLYSSIEQTASEIRADVWAANSDVYSYIQLTASNIKTEVGNAESGLYSTIEQTAESIRAAVWAANSDIYSYIEISASSIHSEVGNTLSGFYSSIQQTAESIRTDVWAANSDIYSYILQTASGIRSEVGNAQSNIYSEIAQNAYDITLKVSQGDVATQLAVEVGNVTITGGNLVVDGMVTADNIESVIAGIGTLAVGDLNGYDADFMGNVDISGNLYVLGGIYHDGVPVLNAVNSFGTPTASGGQISIPYTTLSGGTGTINFNIADTQFYQDGVSAAEAGVTLSGEWAGTTAAGKAYTVTASNGKTDSSPAVNGVIKSGVPSWDADYKGFTQDLSVQDANSESLYLQALSFDTTDSYDAGVASVIMDTVSIPATPPYDANAISYSVLISVVLSNGSTASETKSFSAGAAYDAGKNSVDFTNQTSGWVDGFWDVYISNGKSTSVAMPSAASWTGQRNTLGGFTVTCTVGGKEYTHVFAI